MFDLVHLMTAVLVVGLPLLALIFVLLSNPGLAERHHSHHDTYLVSPVVSRTLMLVMLFMGVLGGLTGWLCRIGVFAPEPLVPFSFFAAFQVTLLVMVAAVTRYQVMAYDDYMVVRPAFGHERTIAYDSIERMEWVISLLGPSLLDLRIRTVEGQATRIWCLIDIEQVLLRIDRYEVIED